jgi:hypothetical protein
MHRSTSADLGGSNIFIYYFEGGGRGVTKLRTHNVRDYVSGLTYSEVQLARFLLWPR